MPHPTIRFAAPVALQARAKSPTFKTVAYNGGALVLAGYKLPVVIDLATLKAAERVVILRDHRVDQPVGHATAVRIGATVEAEGTLSASGAHAEEIIATAKNGFPWSVSVGATPGRIEEVQAGQVATVNGRQFRGPILIGRECTLREISFVAIGADADARISIAAKAAGKESTMTFEEWLASLGLSTEGMSDETKSALQLAFDAQNPEPAAEPAAAPVAASAQATAALQRQALAAIRGARGTGPVAFHGGQGAPHQGQTIEASLCIASGIPEKRVGQWYGERVTNEATRAENRKMGLHGVLRATIAAAGNKHVPVGRFGDAELRTAFESARMLQAAGFSTVSLPGILSNVAGKSMLSAFMDVPTTYRKFCRINGNIQDFKTTTRYRLTGEGRFEEVAPTGELAHGTLSEDSQTNILKTYGKMLALTRTMLINDDLGALTDVPKILGRMGAVSLERAVFLLLLANAGNFFHTNNGNINSGGDSALTLAGLDAANQLILNQLDENEDPAMIVPSVLLVPPALSMTAKSLMRDQQLVGSTTANVLLPGGNPWSGAFEPVTSPFLSEATDLHANADDASWYLLTGSNDNSVIEVGFLQGKESPTIEDADMDFSQLGMQFRAFWDWGVAWAESRGGCLNVGA